MLNWIRRVMQGCSYFLAIPVLIFLWIFFHWVIRCISEKSFRGENFDDLKRDLKGIFASGGVCQYIYTPIVLIGIVNIVLSLVLGSTSIGSFYEKPEYTERYEAIIAAPEVDIFCIATVYHTTESYENRKGRAATEEFYTVTGIDLPYGRSIYVDEDLDPDTKTARLSFDTGNYKLLLRDKATESSEEILSHYSLSDPDGLCASKSGDVFHLPSCRCVRSIKSKNLIYFPNAAVACIFGFSPCSVCSPAG